ncbi:hypothetical protein [Mucilaginibacter antarcticus]|uniref:hypothetical protein n=1 Tax=Mucilaginibacter antarcticus TaxID=1855725 RepID=UPI003640291B
MKKLILYFFVGCAWMTQTAKGQSPDAVIDVQHYSFNIQLNDATDNIKGKADIAVKFLKTPGSFNIGLVKRTAWVKA